MSYFNDTGQMPHRIYGEDDDSPPFRLQDQLYRLYIPDDQIIETEKAYGIKLEKVVWLPKSKLHCINFSEKPKGYVYFMVPHWLWIKHPELHNGKGLHRYWRKDMENK